MVVPALWAPMRCNWRRMLVPPSLARQAAMMRLAPSGEGLGRIARLLEEGTIRPDVATVYALRDAAQAWKDIAGNLPGVHGMSPSGPGAPRRKKHGKIVLRVA